jgi:hypothetical protein
MVIRLIPTYISKRIGLLGAVIGAVAAGELLEERTYTSYTRANAANGPMTAQDDDLAPKDSQAKCGVGAHVQKVAKLQSPGLTCNEESEDTNVTNLKSAISTAVRRT